MDSFADGIIAATVDASPEIREAAERLKAAEIETDKADAKRTADIAEAAKLVPPSCLVDIKTREIKFISFLPDADAAATVALLEKEKARLEGEPGSKARGKKIRTLESLIAQFSARIAPATTVQTTSRRGKRIDKQLRRKAARADLERKDELR